MNPESNMHHKQSAKRVQKNRNLTLGYGQAISTCFIYVLRINSN